MTGYGQAEASSDAATVVTEVRSVNHRFLDLSFRVPRSLQSRERDMREQVKRALARGRVYVTVTIDPIRGADRVELDTDRMAAYLQVLRAFAAEHGLEERVSLDTLVALPDVVRSAEDEPDAEAVWPLVEDSLERALAANREMREAEGRALAADLASRMEAVGAIVGELEGLAPDVSRRHAETLRKRVAALAGDARVDADRLVTEIALMADRLDFTEELTRLRSHEAQFNETLARGGEVSKKLTYLLQEMHREATTIGSKASDSDVVQRVVALKEELERIREQVQNIE